MDRIFNNPVSLGVLTCIILSTSLIIVILMLFGLFQIICKIKLFKSLKMNSKDLIAPIAFVVIIPLIMALMIISSINKYTIAISTLLITILLIALFCFINNLVEFFISKSKNTFQLFLYSFLPFLVIYLVTYTLLLQSSNDITKAFGIDLNDFLTYFDQINLSLTFGFLLNNIIKYEKRHKELTELKNKEKTIDFKGNNAPIYLKIKQNNKTLIYEFKKCIEE